MSRLIRSFTGKTYRVWSKLLRLCLVFTGLMMITTLFSGSFATVLADNSSCSIETDHRDRDSGYSVYSGSGYHHAGTSRNLSHFLSNSATNIGQDEDNNDMDKDTLYIKEMTLAKDVVEREPVEVVESYTMSDARAWCFARIHNSDEMQDVYFEWYYEDDLYFEMNSKIGISPNWRTYSSVGLQPGTWRVVLKNREGEILEELRFHVSE